MFPTQPTYMPSPLGINADKDVIPPTTPIDSAIPSFESLFPVITSVPLTSGGLPVERKGMNGLFALLSEYCFMLQSGLFPEYDARVNYIFGSFIRYNGDVYYCIKENGPDSENGVKNPDDVLYWIRFDHSSFNPTGTIIAFAGNSAPYGYLLCDGSAISRTQYSKLFNVISTTYGAGDGRTTFNLPNLVDDRFLQGGPVNSLGTKKNAGLPQLKHTHTFTTSTTGNHLHTAQSAGAHTHTTNSTGSHTHITSTTGNHSHTTNEQGNHNHNRGNMEITGKFSGCGTGDWSTPLSGGAITLTKYYNEVIGARDRWITTAEYSLNASKSWTGNTNSAGTHSHTTNTTGNHNHTAQSAGAHTHTAQSAGAHTHTTNTTGNHNHTGTTAEGGSQGGLDVSNTVQPKSLIINYYIKY